MTQGVRHNQELAEAIAEAARLQSVQYLQRMAVKLARKLQIDLPRYPQKKPCES